MTLKVGKSNLKNRIILSDEQIDDLDGLFKHIDTDHDGLITSAQATTALLQVYKIE
jgi:Ca2+-binding EF-hand superfamily protein